VYDKSYRDFSGFFSGFRFLRQFGAGQGTAIRPGKWPQAAE
jgi:hypothetical protein